MRRKKPISVLGYDNYRLYLEDMYHHLKKTRRGFSYRAFSAMAGLTSPNFLKLVIMGDRNLGQDSVERCAEALDLTKKEHEYFRVLVSFNQARTTEEKNCYVEKLRKFRPTKEVRRLEKRHHQFCSHWYILVIREMVDLQEFRPDPAWIASRINPPIRKSEAKQALHILEDLGILLLEHGTYRKRERSLSTGDEVQSVLAKNLLHQMIQLGCEALDRVPSEQRDISALTLSITQAQFEAIKRRIQLFRKEILQLATTEDRTDKIYQFNFQFFPLLRDPAEVVVTAEEPATPERTEDTDDATS